MALPSDAPPSTSTPASPLLAITLPSPGAGPPIVLPEAAVIQTPKSPFPRVVLAAALVPMKFLRMTFPVVCQSTTPSRLFPEMRLSSTRLFAELLLISSPAPKLPSARLPVSSVPM
jgi:hypothetical protein